VQQTVTETQYFVFWYIVSVIWETKPFISLKNVLCVKACFYLTNIFQFFTCRRTYIGFSFVSVVSTYSRMKDE